MLDTVVLVGRQMEDSMICMLGTGFIVSHDGKVATSRHVVGDSDKNLVIIPINIKSMNDYQDTTDVKCTRVLNVKIIDSDPFRDVVILKGEISCRGTLLSIDSFDDINVGEEIQIIGYPHCVEGRRVLTYQRAIIGAKVLLEAQGVKSKHAVINTQTRPGQSGSMILNSSGSRIIGMLVGAFAPEGGLSLGGINPRELHQTTHCISAEYINQMIEED